MTPELATIVAITFPVLVGLVGWFARHNYLRIERKVDEEGTARVTAIAAERAAFERTTQADREMFLRLYKDERDARDAFFKRIEEGRQQDRHEARDDLARVAASFAAFREQVARDNPTYGRVAEMLAPINQGIADIKAAQERLFEKLDSKADK